MVNPKVPRSVGFVRVTLVLTGLVVYSLNKHSQFEGVHAHCYLLASFGLLGKDYSSQVNDPN